MGATGVHPDEPAAPLAGGALHPPDVALARAYTAWALADERPAVGVVQGRRDDLARA